MSNSALTSAIQLQAQLDEALERARVAEWHAERSRAENDEIRARNIELERTVEQLKFSTAALAHGYLEHD